MWLIIWDNKLFIILRVNDIINLYAILLRNVSTETLYVNDASLKLAPSPTIYADLPWPVPDRQLSTVVYVFFYQVVPSDRIMYTWLLNMSCSIICTLSVGHQKNIKCARSVHHCRGQNTVTSHLERNHRWETT